MKTFLLLACLLLNNVDLSYAFGVLNIRGNTAATRLYTVIDADEPSDSPIPAGIQDGSTAEEAEAVRLERLRAADEAAKQFKSNLHEAVEELKTKGSDVNVNVNVKDDETTKKVAPTPFGELLRGATTTTTTTRSSNKNNNNNEEMSIEGADTQNSIDEYDHTLLRTQLKSKLYQLSASYDRGFGATPKARQEVNDIIEQLSELNPTQNSARGINGDSDNEEEDDDDDVPLKGIWRMIWTSAYDVVSLGASPISTTSAIYQDIRNPPVAINIIDFIPKTQSILPIALSPSSLLRAEVATRASSRNVPTNDRVGLIFEGVKLQPIELFGQKVDNLPPLNIDFKWQRNLVEKLIDFVPGIDKATLGFSDDDGGDVDVNAPGYFDILYVDDELLVISQQAPGGIFALVRVDSCEP